VVYDPAVSESRLMRIELEGVENVMEEPFLNDDPVGDIEDIDSDESDSILRFKQTTQTIPQTTSRPVEWGPKPRFKTTASKPFTTPSRRPQTRSLRPPIILSLPEGALERPAKKSATTSAKKSTILSSQKNKKPTKKREAPEQVEDVEAPKKKRMKKTMSSTEKYEHFLQKSVVWGKIVKVPYFQEQGLDLFLRQLEAQSWLDLFTNTNKGCSVPDLVEFYVNCVVTNGW